MKSLAKQSGQPGRQLDRALLALFGRMAKAGHVVYHLPDGTFLCSKFGLTRHCNNFDELEQFAARLGLLE